MTSWLTWHEGRATHFAPYTPLRQCHACGCWGSPAHVKRQAYGLTCSSCWGPLAAIQRDQQALNVVAGLIRQLERA